VGQEKKGIQMSDTIEVNGITFTKEKPTRAGYYLYATVSPNRTWVSPITVEPEYENTTELGCCHYQWHPLSELNYYWHRLVSEQEFAAVTKERDEWKDIANRALNSVKDFAVENRQIAQALQESIARIKRLEAFANRFLSPEDLGYQVSNWTRDDAREALGRNRVESGPQAKEAR
jgi:hypothetical protein